MSRSSSQISRTMRRPSQTHSGFPAGPLMACAASLNSSVLRWLSLVTSAALSAAGLPDWSWAWASPLWAKAPPYRSEGQARGRRGGAKPHFEA